MAPDAMGKDCPDTIHKGAMKPEAMGKDAMKK
jgi:hypothetical protein